jgi:hypothetical protein
MNQTRNLTWNRAAALIMLVFVGSMIAGVYLRRLGVFPSPSLFQWTPFFYFVFVGAVPALIALLICIRRKPIGGRLLLIISPFFIGILFLFYMAIINPSLYPKIECAAGTRSGLFEHAECTCSTGDSGSQLVACSSRRLFFSPLTILRKDP